MKNKKSRRLFLLFSFIGISLTSSAQSDEAKTIQVFQGENSLPSFEYALDDTRKIFFGADDFTFTFYSSSDATFKLDDVRCIKFGDGIPSSINNAETTGDEISLSFNGRALVVDNCNEPSVLTIYDITGRPVMSTKVSSSTEISLDNLASGIYMANIKNTTIKFSI